MARHLKQVDTVKKLRARVSKWKRDGRKTALVSTMGALHEGHLTLVDCARQHADRVVISIFVNPTQFAEGEDLSSYPRDVDGDLAKPKTQKAKLAFVPAGDEMYPSGFATSVSVKGPVCAGLEDKFRPHFFSGVATVIAKLLMQAQCDFAIFGQKDYQQLMTATQMARDLDIPTKIIGADTIRDDDGLAMPSRNMYLAEKERAKAPRIQEEMQAAAALIRDGSDIVDVMKKAKRNLKKSGIPVDYLEVRNANTLAKVTDASEGPLRMLAAAQAGRTRLIDNIAV